MPPASAATAGGAGPGETGLLRPKGAPPAQTVRCGRRPRTSGARSPAEVHHLDARGRVEDHVRALHVDAVARVGPVALVVGVEALLPAVLHLLEPRGRREAEDAGAGLGRWGEHDAHGLVEHGLVAALRVEVHRGEEAHLGRVRVDPAQGDQVVLHVVHAHVLLPRVRGGALVAAARLGRHEDVRHVQRALLQAPGEHAAGLDVVCSVALRHRQEGAREVRRDAQGAELPWGAVGGGHAVAAREVGGGRERHRKALRVRPVLALTSELLAPDAAPGPDMGGGNWAVGAGAYPDDAKDGACTGGTVNAMDAPGMGGALGATGGALGTAGGALPTEAAVTAGAVQEGSPGGGPGSAEEARGTDDRSP
eukprot:CAMPEP_0206005010 /NCGR_PEP_ID=MMETSP1464-20131121/4319_1 /ASSEMBLY_ACC=CAM_ASM_001124 /TAXON_ID=119497 /ORGANISM="Exanthemachrysis gayraliae, Strain RCC1523" /LENGTH=364 /DNA_ID=CAMNT_0053378431 /DNA_START=74 /DNA_END=1170 /DNA_ORIENTATION=+